MTEQGELLAGFGRYFHSSVLSVAVSSRVEEHQGACKRKISVCGGVGGGGGNKI